MSNKLELTCIKRLTMHIAISRLAVYQRNMTLKFSIDDEIVLNKATSDGWYWIQSVNDDYSYGELGANHYEYLIQIEDIENYFE